MMHSQHRVINARLSYDKAENYLYRFNFYSPDFNYFGLREKLPKSRAVLHANELCYVYKIPATFKLDKSRAEYSTILRMAEMFAEFALRSDPNAPLTQSLVNWKPVTQDGPRMCLNINEELQLIPQPEEENLKYFDKLYNDAGAELL